MSENKKYIFMENVLNEITGTFVSLENEDIRRNNQILQEVRSCVHKIQTLRIFCDYLFVYGGNEF